MQTVYEKQSSYKTPSLVRMGEAQDTILGVFGAGFDVDTLFLGANGQEFQSELDLND